MGYDSALEFERKLLSKMEKGGRGKLGVESEVE
jgi:hypothetical protein